MSEKRFGRWNDYSCKVKDNQEDTLLNWEDVVDLLNEQQATISALKEENEQLKSRVDFLEDMCLDILIVLTKDDKLIVKK